MIRKALMLSALAFLSLTTGCPEGRFPFSSSCATDNDCPARDGGHSVCWNLRCVDCHYDADCSEGQVCNTSRHTCDSIDSRVKEPEPEAPPTSLEECAKRCKKGDETCGASCREQFK
jgi:hypothetical protein